MQHTLGHKFIDVTFHPCIVFLQFWKKKIFKLYNEIRWATTSGTYLCVEILRRSQPNGVMSSTVSLPNHTFTGQTYSSKWLTSIVHILSPETDNCPSWISRRERITVEIFHDQSPGKNVADLGGGWTRDLVSSQPAHPTEPPRPAGNISSDMCKQRRFRSGCTFA